MHFGEGKREEGWEELLATIKIELSPMSKNVHHKRVYC